MNLRTFSTTSERYQNSLSEVDSELRDLNISYSDVTKLVDFTPLFSPLFVLFNRHSFTIYSCFTVNKHFHNNLNSARGFLIENNLFDYVDFEPKGCFV